MGIPHGHVVSHEKLKTLRHKSPDTGIMMSGTGRMSYDADMHQWFIEYECPKYKEIYEIYTPDADRFAHRLAEEMGLE